MGEGDMAVVEEKIDYSASATQTGWQLFGGSDVAGAESQAGALFAFHSEGSSPLTWTSRRSDFDHGSAVHGRGRRQITIM